MRRLHRRRLRITERVRLRFIGSGNLLRHTGNRFRYAVIHPALKFAGDLLEHVPERIRPKIRTRDRRAP